MKEKRARTWTPRLGPEVADVFLPDIRDHPNHLPPPVAASVMIVLRYNVRSWNMLSREPSGDRIASSCRHTAPDLTVKTEVKDRMVKNSLSQFVLGFWLETGIGGVKSLKIRGGWKFWNFGGPENWPFATEILLKILNLENFRGEFPPPSSVRYVLTPPIPVSDLRPFQTMIVCTDFKQKQAQDRQNTFWDNVAPCCKLSPVARQAPTLDGPNRQSLVFSERGQLSQAIPQVHVERILHQRTPIARFDAGSTRTK